MARESRHSWIKILGALLGSLGAIVSFNDGAERSWFILAGAGVVMMGLAVLLVKANAVTHTSAMASVAVFFLGLSWFGRERAIETQLRLAAAVENQKATTEAIQGVRSDLRTVLDNVQQDRPATSDSMTTNAKSGVRAGIRPSQAIDAAQLPALSEPSAEAGEFAVYRGDDSTKVQRGRPLAPSGPKLAPSQDNQTTLSKGD